MRTILDKLKLKNNIYLYAIVVLCFLSPALYNGFPLVFSDSGAYIFSGLEGFLPEDRPMFYGLWIWMSSLGTSLWWTIIFQSIALSFVFINTCHDFFQIKMPNTVILAMLLSAFTGVGWYCSQIMPDIWLAISFLSLLHLLFHNKLKWIFALLAICGMLFHNSHIPIIIISLLGIFLISITRNHSFNINWRWPLSTIAISILVLLISNGIIKDQWTPFRGGHVYVMGRLIDTGILSTYLNEKCGSKNFRICAYKDSLPPDSRNFLWDPESPLTKEGGWSKVKLEYNDIIRDALTTPKYLVRFIGQSVTGTLGQLFQNDVGSGLTTDWYSSSGSPPYAAIKMHYPHQLNSYLLSRQNTNLWGQGLDFSRISFINQILLLMGIILILIPGWYSPNQNLLFLIFLQLILANAFVVATFANVYDRLQGRITWILVALTLAYLTQKLQHRLQRFKV